jgi:hypothetical protein
MTSDTCSHSGFFLNELLCASKWLWINTFMIDSINNGYQLNESRIENMWLNEIVRNDTCSNKLFTFMSRYLFVLYMGRFHTFTKKIINRFKTIHSNSNWNALTSRLKFLMNLFIFHNVDTWKSMKRSACSWTMCFI